jgi:hypothetical protein
MPKHPSPNALKFYGNFRDLKVLGFAFQKMYARNYRCYYKETKYGETVFVWQHLGGYVEISDLAPYTSLIVNAIIDGTLPECFAIDKICMTIEPEELRHRTTTLFITNPGFSPSTSPNDQKLLDQHNARWQCSALEDETIELLRKMISFGWIRKTEIML